VNIDLVMFIMVMIEQQLEKRRRLLWWRARKPSHIA